MKQSYLLLVLLGLLGPHAWGQATAWRPFQPGFVYTFVPVGSSGTVAAHTLRVDSVYTTTGGDSVYTFNRLLRSLVTGSAAGSFAKSRNNLLGARLRWQPGTSSYYLEANAEPLTGAATATTLLLRPRAAVGSTWVASTAPALTATLTSRTLGQVGAAADSLATITLSNGQQLVLSKRNGLLRGPQWLTLAASGTAAPTNWYQAVSPQPGLGAYDPRSLFNLPVGTILGYEGTSLVSSGLPCADGNLLRRIASTQQTADSLILTYQDQERISYYGVPGCTHSTGVVTYPVRAGRWAFSLQTGRSAQFPGLALLTNEYRPISSGPALYVNRRHQFNLANAASQINYTPVGFSGVGNYYYYIADIPGITLATNRGIISWQGELSYYQTYYCPGGSSCTLPAAYAGLLPSRAALAAQAATLHPNPASPTESATLTLTAPTPAGATLTLTDALGRQLWSQPVAPGQSALPVPLAGQSAGFYLVQLALPGAAPLTWKLLLE